MDLKKCPFCGEKELDVMVEGSELDPKRRVYCIHCGAQGPIDNEDDLSAEGAWNQRSKKARDRVREVMRG